MDDGSYKFNEKDQDGEADAIRLTETCTMSESQQLAASAGTKRVSVAVFLQPCPSSLAPQVHRTEQSTQDSANSGMDAQDCVDLR